MTPTLGAGQRTRPNPRSSHELAASSADFPAAETPATGGRRWQRAAIEAWAAAHANRDPLDPGIEIPPIDRWPWQVQTVVDLAHEEARALHHDRVDQDHLLLALLHPDSPGAARAVLQSFGVTAAPLRAAWVASMGDPYEPHHRGILFAAGQGVDPAALRQRVVDLTEGQALPEPVPPPVDEPAWPAERDVAPGPQKAGTSRGELPVQGGTLAQTSASAAGRAADD